MYPHASLTRSRLVRFASGVIFSIGACGIAVGACVNKSGRGGCYTTITDAVNNASPHETIKVAPGIYHEDVVIGMPLSLIGAGSRNTIIDATGLPNGIYVNGGLMDIGVDHVNVTGFTVKNANFQGILVTNASFVNIADNRVTGNNTHLQLGAPPTCPGLESFLGGVFVAGEGFDCGEGIHLSGVVHSTVSHNIVEANAGGILLSDDTGGTHDNVLSGNIVRNNPYDCGITIASHHFDAENLDPAFGVYHNTITGNTSSANGLATGEGAGVGLFTAAPGGQTYGNVIVDNVLVNNGLPGVTMHSHAFNQDLNDNLIVGNQISGNGADPDPETGVPAGIDVFSDDTGMAAPITGTVILQNTFKREGIDIAVKTPGSVDAHFNSFFDAVGVSNLNTDEGGVDATENWWKCSRGPGGYGCADAVGYQIRTEPWLTKPPTLGEQDVHGYGDSHHHR